MRRSPPKQQKMLKFGWGKRGVSEAFDDLLYKTSDGDAAVVPEKRHSILPDQIFGRQHPWSLGAANMKYKQALKAPTVVGMNKCPSYGCRQERNGWNSGYGKRSSLGRLDDKDSREIQQSLVDKNGWGSGYGRSTEEQDRLAALVRARRRLAENGENESESEDRKRNIERNGWNSAYGKRGVSRDGAWDMGYGR